MIEAERLLFEEALHDPANQRFVLLSDRLSTLQPQNCGLKFHAYVCVSAVYGTLYCMRY